MKRILVVQVLLAACRLCTNFPATNFYSSWWKLRTI